MAFFNGLCAVQGCTAIFDDGKSLKLKKSMEGLFNSLLIVARKHQHAYG